jgi:hypothetical protein
MPVSKRPKQWTVDDDDDVPSPEASSTPEPITPAEKDLKHRKDKLETELHKLKAKVAVCLPS